MLQINNVWFSYGGKKVLENIDFNVRKGNHISIIGESGCGKSTLLKIIYGLLHVEEGTVFWNDTQVLGPNFNLVPGELYMKYLSQDFDLMPFITVEENVSQYLSVFYPYQLKERTLELLELIEMVDEAKTMVKNLSGGQQQRVALARVLAHEPEVLLLDEPFSHIDNFRKNSLRRKVFAHLKKKGITCVVASHDATDVLSFADEIIVLKDHAILTKGSPETLYQNPGNNYVASLFGEANIIPIQLLKPYAEINKSILVYPHEFQTSKESGLKVWVKNCYFKGSHYLIEGMVNEEKNVFFSANTAYELESELYLNVPIETINLRLRLSE